MHQHLNTLYQGQSLTRDAARDAFGQVVRGEVDPIVLASLLTALKIKGETPEEIAGAAEALLAEARDFPRPDYAFCDIVGTGGDGLNTINVSTTSALVAAACGLKVAKHGNRSVSSKSGSSDLLDKMGIKLDMSPAQARRCLDELGVCFLFAPQYHAGVRHAMPVRQALKTRTLFNVLGPLINPARPSHLLMGVARPELVNLVAETLLQSPLYRAAVVCGAGNYDEITPIGPAQMAVLHAGTMTQMTLDPADFGIEPCTVEDLSVNGKDEAVAVLTDILDGNGPRAMMDMVTLNVGMAIYLLEENMDMALCMARAREAVSGGFGRKVLHAA